MHAEEEDRKVILRVHREWLESNHGPDIERMGKVFAGEQYLIFNLNGHTYRGLQERSSSGSYRHHIEIPDSPGTSTFDSKVRVDARDAVGRADRHVRLGFRRVRRVF
jgi:hypothetical protein